MNPLITLAIVLFVLGLVIMFGDIVLRLFNPPDPEVQRKWTDPAFRDRGPN